MIVCEYDRPHTGPCLPWEGTGQHREHIAVAADQAEWDERIAAHVALLLPHYIDGSAPGLTCGNDGEHGFDAATIEGGPGSAPTPPDLADPSVEGASNGER